MKKSLSKNQVTQQAILQVLTEMANKKANVFMSCKQVILAVESFLGWDEKNPEKDGFTTKENRKSHADNMRWFISREYVHLQFAKPPLVCSNGYGKWGLTENGLSKVVGYLNNGKNWTKEYLDDQLRKPTSTFLKDLRQAIASRMPLSAMADKIDDHVQEFLVKIISRDAYRDILMSGGTPTISQIKSSGIRSAYTDIRTEGTEPVSRTFYNAKTATELKKQNRNNQNYPCVIKDINGKIIETRSIQLEDSLPEREIKVHLSPYKIIASKDSDGEVQGFDAVDENNYAEQMMFDETWEKASAILYRKFRYTKHDKMAEVLALKAKGLTRQEIVDQTGISFSTVNKILKQAKVLQVFQMKGENMSKAAIAKETRMDVKKVDRILNQIESLQETSLVKGICV